MPRDQSIVWANTLTFRFKLRSDLCTLQSGIRIKFHDLYGS